MADATNVVTEANENNNTASTASTLGVGGVVDLRCDGIDIPGTLRASPPAGATFDITVLTKNDSAVSAPASTTKVYLLLASALNAPPMVIGSRAIAPLGPNATDVGSATVTLPAGVAGAAFVFAKVDADNVVGESNENNNTSASKAITIGADLIVLALDVPGSVTNTAPGATITVHDFTRNDNSAPAGASTTKFYLVTGTTVDSSAVLLGSRAVPALPPSTTNEGFTDLILPATAAGTFRIIAKADADDAVIESNENNNLSTPSQAFTIGADLSVSLDLPGASSALPAGATFTIDDATRNAGGTPIGPTTTKFYLSADKILDGGDVLLGSRPIPALAAGERNPRHRPWRRRH